MYCVVADSISEGYNDLAYTLQSESVVSNGRQQGAIHELTNVSLVLTDPLACILTNPYRNMSGEWCLYLSGTNRVEEFARYSTVWKRLAKPDGTIVSAYGHRLFTKKRFDFALEQLYANPDSKNAVIHMRDTSDMEDGLKDRCCTMYIQFRIVDNKLNMHVCMRSVDFWYGLPYDVFSFAQLMQMMLYKYNKLTGRNVELGEYTHQMLSLHVYEKNWKQVQEMPHMKLRTTRALRMPVYDEFAEKEQQAFLEWEYKVRHGGDVKSLGMELREMKLHPYFETLGAWLTTRTSIAIADENIKHSLEMAVKESKKSVCIDRQVGCVLQDNADRWSVGHNTVIECNKQCNDKHHRICNVKHGEIVALSNWTNQYGEAKPRRAFVTLFPCNPCMTALYENGVEEIYVLGSMVHKSAGTEIPVFLVDEEHWQV